MSGGGNGGYDPKKLGGQFGTALETELGKPPAVFNKPLYAGIGGETQSGADDLYNSAANGSYVGGVQGAIDRFGKMASGQGLGMQSPGYQAMRNQLRGDITKDVGSAFTSSGRFGGGSHVNNLTDQLTSSLGAMDYGNYRDDQAASERAAGMLPGLYQASQMPAMAKLQAGQIRDADAQARLLGQNDLFRRQNDTGRQNLLELLGAFTGSQQNAGMEEEQPWWQSLLGFGAQLL